MEEYYNELKEAFDFRNENAPAIKEIEDKLSSNLNRGFEINNQVFSMDKESIEYGILMKEKEMLEKESDDLRVKKEGLETDFYKKMASIKNKLESDIKAKTESLEKNEKENISEAQTRLETAKKHLAELQGVSLKSKAVEEEIEIEVTDITIETETSVHRCNGITQLLLDGVSIFIALIFQSTRIRRTSG